MAQKNAKTRKKKGPARADAKPRAAARNGHEDIRLWLRLLYCSSHIELIMQSRIMGEFGISLARFDLMAQLERVGGGLTMSEVSRRMMVSNGATTSLVDKLVEDGLGAARSASGGPAHDAAASDPARARALPRHGGGA